MDFVSNSNKMTTASRTRTASRLRVAAVGQHMIGMFPHFSSSSGNCMCLDACCFGDNGCVCRSCPGNDVNGHSNCADNRAKHRKSSAKARQNAAVVKVDSNVL